MAQLPNITLNDQDQLYITYKDVYIIVHPHGDAMFVSHRNPVANSYQSRETTTIALLSTEAATRLRNEDNVTITDLPPP